MPRLSTSPVARFCFYRFKEQVKSAVKQCFSAAEPRVVYQRDFLRYQQGFTACFTEKQRELSILVSL